MVKFENIITKKLAVQLVLTSVLLMSAVIMLLNIIPEKKYSFWPGYHILVINKGDNSRTAEILEKEGSFTEIVSRYNTEIEYSNYNDLEEIELSRIPDRFNNLDPRLDSYMKKAAGFFNAEFKGKGYEIIYLKTELSENETAAVLKKLLNGKTEWQIASASYPVFKWMIFTVYLIIISTLVYVKKIKSYIFFIISALWLIVILKSDIALFYVSVINIVFISYFLEIIDLVLKKWFDENKIEINFITNIKNYLISASVVLFSNAVICFINPQIKSFLIFALVFTAESVFLFLDLNINLRKAENYMHRIFYSIPILETNKRTVFEKWIMIRPVYFYLLVLCISVPAVFFSAPNSRFSVPQPLLSSGIISHGNYYENIKNLSEDNNDSESVYLPDISDYISHLAYQIRLPYKQDYSLPEKGEKISISHYLLNKNNFQKEKKVAYLFTDSWLKDNIIRVKDSGLTGLMLSGNKLTKVVFTNKNSAVNPGFFVFLYSFFYITLILMVIWKEKSGKTNYEKHILPVIKRRKQQAA